MVGLGGSVHCNVFVVGVDCTERPAWALRVTNYQVLYLPLICNVQVESLQSTISFHSTGQGINPLYRCSVARNKVAHEHSIDVGVEEQHPIGFYHL